MDSFEWNKIAGAVLGTLLFVVAVRIASGFLFEVKEPAKPGYVVQGVEAPTGTGATPAAAEEQLPDWGTVLPKASVADGKSTSTRCEQCHDLSKGGPNKIGPNLWGVVGRPRASHPGFDYSSAMKAKGGSWSYDELFKFLKSPGAYIPGTKMSFAGLPKADDRINLIAYLRTDMDSPAAIPPPQPAKATPAQAPGGKAPAAAATTGGGAAAATTGGGAAAATTGGGAAAAPKGPNGTAAMAPGNQPAGGISTAGSSNEPSGKSAAPATGKQPPNMPPKKP